MERSLYSVVGFLELVWDFLAPKLKRAVASTEPIFTSLYEIWAYSLYFARRVVEGTGYDYTVSMGYVINRALSKGQTRIEFREIIDYMREYGSYPAHWLTEGVIKANWFDLVAYSKTHRGFAWDVERWYGDGDYYVITPKNGDMRQEFFISTGSKSSPHLAGEMVDALANFSCTFVAYDDTLDDCARLQMILANGKKVAVEYLGSETWDVDYHMAEPWDTENFYRAKWGSWKQVVAHLTDLSKDPGSGSVRPT